MEASASKRRKTSRSSSIPIESTTPPDAPPTQPEQAQEPQSSPSRSASRPSFASPTKSSLARHNPEVLSRTQDAAAERRRLRAANDLPASQPILPDDDRRAAQPDEPRPEGDVTAVSPVAESSAAQERSRSESVAAQSHVERSPSRRGGANVLGAQQPRRTPNRPQSRPLPPQAADNVEATATIPIVGRGRYRVPLFNTGVLPTVVQEEPELPPTPEHPDPVVSTPPSGIHNTPSKRRRTEEERRQYSSPSQHPLSQELAPQETLAESAREKSPAKPPQKQSKKAIGKRPAVRPIPQAQPPPPQIEEQPAAEPEPQSEFAPGTHPRRSVRIRERNWDKIQERDALLQQVKKLELDLELAAETSREAGRGVSVSSDQEALLDLLRRHLLAAEQEPEPDSNTKWLETVTNPIAILGFNGSASTEDAILPQADHKEEAEQKPISHHPIEMSASEELPYLQVFTPLTYTSTVVTIPPSDDEPDQPTFQKHTISVHSASPPGLFAARIEMVVNMRSLAVASLSVPRLDPAAATELQPFLDSITSQGASYHPALTRNLSVACWALREWYRVAIRRAKFWHALDVQLGPDSEKSGLVELGLAFKREKKRQRARRRGRDVVDAESSSGDVVVVVAGEHNVLGGLESMVVSRSELLPHMGRTAMDLEVPVLAEAGVVADLRVTWKIEFDWTGEARNKLGVAVGVPGKWHAIDTRKSIVGIPKLFDTLVQGGEDPLAAVRRVAVLLAGEPSA